MISPDTPDPIERAVRDHLDRAAAGVDARSILTRVKAAGASPSTVRRGWRTRLAWVSGAAVTAVAAGIALVVLFGDHRPTGDLVAKESPEELIRQAQVTHAAPADRCYAVAAEWDPNAAALVRVGPLARRAKLWTRGDQFWVEATAPDGHAVAWGQNKDGTIWIAPNRRFGLVYDPTEVAEPILRYCDLMSLRVVTTLGEVLEQYDLFRRDSGLPGEPVRIDATLRQLPRNPTPRFRRVELELDPDTKVIRKAVLTRQINGEPVGTLTFTLVDTAAQPDRAYEVRGHLDDDGRVFDGKFQPKLPGGPQMRPDPRAKVRDEFLKRMQGPK